MNNLKTVGDIWIWSVAVSIDTLADLFFLLIDTANAGMCEAVSGEEIVQDNALLKAIHRESEWVEITVRLMLIQMGLNEDKARIEWLILQSITLPRYDINNTGLWDWKSALQW